MTTGRAWMSFPKQTYFRHLVLQNLCWRSSQNWVERIKRMLACRRLRLEPEFQPAQHGAPRLIVVRYFSVMQLA